MNFFTFIIYKGILSVKLNNCKSVVKIFDTVILDFANFLTGFVNKAPFAIPVNFSELLVFFLEIVVRHIYVLL
jgi:hypothetical protein